MKKLTLLFSLLGIAFFPGRTQEKVINLYDGPAPGSENWTWTEAENNNNQWNTKVVYNVSKPTLTVFRPEASASAHTAAIICPGGAFYALSIENEGVEVAKWLVKKGITCFVLKYRLGHSMTDDPTKELAQKMGTKEFEEDVSKVIPLSLADGRAAIAWVRAHAREYDLSPGRIGIIGFSAGGTVAAAAAFNYNSANKPDFVAPIYPYFPPEMQGPVANDAPPMFIAAASDDQLNLAPHSVALYNKWADARRTAELHMYARGGHGFGMTKKQLPSDTWIDGFYGWLTMKDVLPEPEDPAFAVYEKKEFMLGEGKTLPYRILYPLNYDRSRKYPVVLFLHGAGERGNDNESQLIHGGKLFITPGNRQQFPAIVIFPQCPQESFWAAASIDRSKQPSSFGLSYSLEANWPLVAANELVRKVIKEEAADPARVYVTGLSMGGMGTFESVYRYPELYAAAMPICGGGDTNLYDKRVKKTAFWVFHGGADAVVNVTLSRQMVEKLKKLKNEVKYTEYPGVNHNSWDSAFAEPAYLSWMFAHKR